MAHYLVTARAKDGLDELRARLETGEIRGMRPFGKTLEHSLDAARLHPDGTATWEEEDYCSPPLAMERAAVLDRYFTELQVEPVDKGQGWARIAPLPALWAHLPLGRA